MGCLIYASGLTLTPQSDLKLISLINCFIPRVIMLILCGITKGDKYELKDKKYIKNWHGIIWTLSMLF